MIDKRRKSGEVDEQVGQNIRKARVDRELALREVADLCGLTYQQVQKYENGSSRVTSARFVQLSKILNVPISYFFEGLNGENEKLPVSAISYRSAAAFEKLPKDGGARKLILQLIELLQQNQQSAK